MFAGSYSTPDERMNKEADHGRGWRTRRWPPLIALDIGLGPRDMVRDL